MYCTIIIIINKNLLKQVKHDKLINVIINLHFPCYQTISRRVSQALVFRVEI
jgi:hypothetical protein